MPPYENQSMHDMHALLQQFDTLNAAHAPEHLELPSMPSMPDLGITKTIKDQYAKRVQGKDLDKEKQWTEYRTVEPKRIVLENTFIDIIGAVSAWTVDEIDALKKTIQGNSKAKVLLEGNIVANPTSKATKQRPPPVT